MADILHQFPIQAPPRQVFDAISSPAGLDAWWTLRSAGEPRLGAVYQFWFGPEYDWRGVVSRCILHQALEWELTAADADWTGTRVGFTLEEQAGSTLVHFHHLDWDTPNNHFRISTFCWAMYLRLLKRYVEHGEIVPYAERLDA